MAEVLARSGSAARVLKAVARVPLAPWWVVRHLPPIVWNFLVSRGARVAALLWLAGLGYFLVVASARTYATIQAEGAREAAAAEEAEREREALTRELVFKDVDELHGEKDKRLARYKGEFDNMIVDAGPPSDGGKKGGGIAGWIRRNKKHTKRAISDKETLELLNEEMGPGFGALAAVDPEGEGGGISNTLARMKQISRLRGGKGSAQPSAELLDEMSKQGFDREMLAPAGAQPGDGDSDEGADDDVPSGTLVAAAAESDEADEEEASTEKEEPNGAATPAGAATPPGAATPTANPKPNRGFDLVSLGNAAATAVGPALEAAAAANVDTAPRTTPSAATSDEGPQDELRKKLAELAPPGKLDLVVRADRVILRLPADAFRAGRTATMTREARKLLTAIAPLLEAEPGWRYLVVGDSSPGGRGRDSARWHRSAARALEVSRHLVDSGVNPNRLSLRGFRQQVPEAVTDRVEIQFVRTGPTSRPASGGP